jgi:hypothetical protein
MILNGSPFSCTSDFKTALLDTDAWNLVSFIHTLAPR